MNHKLKVNQTCNRVLRKSRTNLRELFGCLPIHGGEARETERELREEGDDGECALLREVERRICV